MFNPVTFYWSVCVVTGNWPVIYLCIRGINFVPFYDFDIWIWNCSDSGVCFVFYFIYSYTSYKNRIRIRIFLLPIKVPQGANNLIQWLKWLETYKDTCKHKKTKKTPKKPGKHIYVQWLHGQIRVYQIPP